MADITFDCPQCGNNLVVDESGAGLSAPCPECSQIITIPSPATAPRPTPPQGDIVFNCQHCKQLIEAPLAMFGQLIDCPACNNPVEVRRSSTLKPLSGQPIIPPSPAPLPPTPPPSPQQQTQPCPYCGGPVLPTVQKCRHCGEWLNKQGKAIFKASSEFIGLLAWYSIMDANKSVLARLSPGEVFEVPINRDTKMYVKYTGGFGGAKEVTCYAKQTNRFAICKSQTGLSCVVSRVDVIDSD